MKSESVGSIEVYAVPDFPHGVDARRGKANEQRPDPTQTEGANQTEEQVLQAELAHLKEKRRLRALRKEIDDLRSRLAEDDKLGIQQSLSRKRDENDGDGVANTDPVEVKRRKVEESKPQIPEPKMYTGRKLHGLIIFIRSCLSYFDAQPTLYPDDISKIQLAEKYLRDDAKDAWHRLKRASGTDNYDWDRFKVFLLNELMPPDLRAANASRPYPSTKEKKGQPVNGFLLYLDELEIQLEYEKAQQKKGQSVRRFVSYLDELEVRLEPYTEKQRCGHLLHGLRPPLAKAILEHESSFESRAELVDAASEIEELQANERRPGKKNNGQAEKIPGPKFKEEVARRDTHRRPHNTAPGPRDRGEILTTPSPAKCSHCRRTNHATADCRRNNTAPGPERPGTGRRAENSTPLLPGRCSHCHKTNHATAECRRKPAYPKKSSAPNGNGEGVDEGPPDQPRNTRHHVATVLHRRDERTP
ncbi:MAG: hypothetical protein M1837_003659 [Sclerophora amabilis]|nr:MAG: hypothetical protein M1837_003659 [Sclerophora amabilis]